MLQVVRFACMPIGFSFEKHLGVGIIKVVPTFLFVDIGQGGNLPHQAYKPFADVPDVERQEQHFAHLTGVYAFVSQHLVIYLHVVTHQQQSEEIDGGEAWQRQQMIANDFHVTWAF